MGEKAGHPFRGNQFGKGKGGAKGGGGGKFGDRPYVAPLGSAHATSGLTPGEKSGPYGNREYQRPLGSSQPTAGAQLSAQGRGKGGGAQGRGTRERYAQAAELRTQRDVRNADVHPDWKESPDSIVRGLKPALAKQGVSTSVKSQGDSYVVTVKGKTGAAQKLMFDWKDRPDTVRNILHAALKPHGVGLQSFDTGGDFYAFKVAPRKVIAANIVARRKLAHKGA
jgi:hypothetical protein